ncbi:MAG TPA: PIN domain-containing protein [Opitutaceae bacterium]|nr:PIN domain-containing protein [Opitutaceae bacterium]
MIHLDANYLILATVAGSPEEQRIRAWLARGDELATSSIAWMEFVSGPVSPAVVTAMAEVIDDRVHPVERKEAELAAKLFNEIGRKRALRYDCLIAAVAISAGAALATNNQSDYAQFVGKGLRLE